MPIKYEAGINMNKKKVIAGLGILLLTSIFPLETQCILSSNVWVDKTCGSTYRIGDAIVIFFSVNEPAYIELWLTYPDGYTKQLASEQVSGGIAHHVNGKIGELSGKRILLLKAWNGDEYDEDTCIYYGGETGGSIRVESNPTGGKCYLDGNYKGKTPLTIPDVPPGSHTIKITKSGYVKWTKTVTVYSNEIRSVSAKLQKVPGSIKITSIPSEADCYLDGIYAGVTPLIISDVSPGSHIIMLKKDNYHDWRDSVYVSAGETSSAFVNVTLEEKPGTIYVESDPSGAEIYLGGNYIGKTPVTVSVQSGSHTLTLKHFGYHEKTVYIDVYANESITQYVFMQKMFWRTWYFSPLVLVALMLPGFFMYLQQRRIAETQPATKPMPTFGTAARIARAPFVPVEMMLNIRLERLNRCPICEGSLDEGEVLECTHCRDEGFTCTFHRTCWEKHKIHTEIRNRTRCYKHYNIYVPERDIKYPFRMLVPEDQNRGVSS